MTYNPLSPEEKLHIQKRIRAEQALKLCIIMMLSDRDIHDEEIKSIYSIIKEEDFFSSLIMADDDLIDLISDMQIERSNSKLEDLLHRYSKIKNPQTREYIFRFLDKVMIADGIIHDKELSMINYLKEIWN
jgi:uncharacterized tellurite resistance protein B-like protein